MSLVIFCLLFSFVDYVPVKGEIIGYLSLTAWLISLSIMLSSSLNSYSERVSPWEMVCLVEWPQKQNEDFKIKKQCFCHYPRVFSKENLENKNIFYYICS